MISRRQTLSLLGASTAALAMPKIASATSGGTFRIGWQKNGVLALAKNTGVLEKRLAPLGFTITWAEFSSGPPLLEALGAGALDFGPTGDVPPLFAQAAGANLRYVGTYRGAPSGSAILVHKDGPIKSLADLKGQRLAFKRGSSAHNFVVKALRKGGLTVNDVKPADLSPADAGAAFKTGNIDAWAIWDPYFAVAEADPNTRVLITGEGIIESWSYYFGQTDFVRDHPQVILDVLDELAKTGAAAQADLDKTVPALAQLTGVSEAITRTALTRPGADLGKVSIVPDEALANQQALADEFYEQRILPRKLKVADIVWRPKAS
ncbi:ABC transporter substrate-binding protein [Xaviernesmea oryzae]|uniref:Putative aliphatic sulfonates-binding protein n=1 Tax=Xaviernesmea oryzae TaxID=464029 RepID=A0A1Q9AYV2_9HYPH|nr:aliphatic sulfonate ABC transporter substrate-binding protein [Xaviernesmea oryzae]OLP60881.1 ABC transporter substrate-binding protein [Xaviernesmea oryzae]SEL23021.1 sulfonate transport system substrate-binding protein [Xaviernesmea oryzae]